MRRLVGDDWYMLKGFKRSVARLGFKLFRWNQVSLVEPEVGKPSILIGAPHTSNWDFVMMVGIAWELGIDFRFLGKDSLFKFPLGPLMRAFGGIPVNRKNPFGLVERLVEDAKNQEGFTLVVTPEGTRGSGKYWKSGFYRIATQANLPITLGYVSKENRSCGLGVTFVPSGDVIEDMDFVRAFYADKSGLKPQFRTEPRLREEEKARRERGEISDDSAQ